MSGDQTIREIKERLREEGYTSETIGEVLREVNSSFLAEDAGVVGGGLAARIGVEVAADILDLDRDVLGRAARGALERHVLEEVGDARDAPHLVDGADIHVGVAAHHRGVVAFEYEQGQSVLERRLRQPRLKLLQVLSRSPRDRRDRQDDGGGRAPPGPTPQARTSPTPGRGSPRRGLHLPIAE